MKTRDRTQSNGYIYTIFYMDNRRKFSEVLTSLITLF